MQIFFCNVYLEKNLPHSYLILHVEIYIVSNVIQI